MNCSSRIKGPEWKIDKRGCLKDEQESRIEMQRGSLCLGVHQWRRKKQNRSVKGAGGRKDRLMNECEGHKKEDYERKWPQLFNSALRGPFITVDRVYECEHLCGTCVSQ